MAKFNWKRTREPDEVVNIGVLFRKESRVKSESKKKEDRWHCSSFCFSAYTVVFGLNVFPIQETHRDPQHVHSVLLLSDI